MTRLISVCIHKLKSNSNLTLVVRKPPFCICKNKGADQLRGNREADQRLSFRYTDSTIPLLSKSEFQASSHLLWLYSLVENLEDRFSHNDAYFKSKFIWGKKGADKVHIQSLSRDNGVYFSMKI